MPYAILHCYFPSFSIKFFVLLLVYNKKLLDERERTKYDSEFYKSRIIKGQYLKLNIAYCFI